MSEKLSSEDLSDVMVQSLALSTLLLEKFEIMTENGLVITKAKQTVKACIPFLSQYVDKVFNNFSEDEIQHITKSASYVSELIIRANKAINVENILTISDRKEILLNILIKSSDKILKYPELYKKIVDSEILNY